MAYDYLVDHARKNVWCTPNQDTQMTLKPARLTPLGGAWNTFEVQWRRLQLPEKGPRFHIYQIGQLHPALMNLFDAFDQWVKLSDACKSQNLIADVYNIAGIQMPRTETWYRVTRDKNLILAVKRQPNIPFDMDNESLFFRVYSNSYFNSSESDPLLDGIDVRGGTLLDSNAIMALQTAYGIAAAKPGHTYAFVNGRRVNAISFVTVKPGDVAEFVYDSSIYKVQEWLVRDLPEFASELDAKHKYLLHYPGMGARGIDYQDDIDLFLVKPGAGASFSGVYYHKNVNDAMRMVTHKDYALPVPYVAGLAAHQNGWTDVTQLKIIAHIRKSGYLRPLVNEHHRIKELYKMPDADVLEAMVGIDATVDVWTASQLEKSGYTQLMKAQLPEISREMVESAYGYNAISKLLADTPSLTRTAAGYQEVDVPFGLVQNSTAYEYDAEGLLLGWHTHGFGYVYRAANPATRLIELQSGLTGMRLTEFYGNESVAIDPKYDYRMYLCGFDNAGDPDNKFVDVTDSGNYAIIDGVLIWLVDPTEGYGLVRSNKTSLGYQLTLTPQSGNLRFSLTHEQVRNGQVGTWVMQVPPGELDIWLNGYSLIEGLDYFVNFPEVVITNKAYLIDPHLNAAQTIAIRARGFCKADLTREVSVDAGFVKYALLSQNTRFDIRDDKVQRIVVGGKVYHRSELLFAEADSGVTVPDARNGAPYLIRDFVVPLKGQTPHDTYALRAVSKTVDQAISDYMTLKIPAPTFDTPNAITERYAVFSPFCCQILNDLVSGVLNPPQMYGFFSDQDVVNICKPYQYLLKYDPTQDANLPSEEFVVIHPHNLDTTMELTVYQYRFALRVIKLYLHNRVSLSTFVQVT